ncbi:hypothetical protein GDO86_007081 [Hymenochirus boettgeri]|uniref:Uncharacterized protein n=1 Tax=Hymenochirus boettgeri TaxID=247094 RepID=A0A8T2ISE6_9PIPI|nr:hypothetical protein GDO86_007081 [Hymenochirus boettgeri]
MLKSNAHASFVSLENQYWESVERELPKWEQFLLGKAQCPFGYNKTNRMLNHSQTTPRSRKENLPPSGVNAYTFPR